MEFYDILTKVLALIEREGRVSYRALKRQFSLDDDYIEDLKAEIIDAKRLAVDEEGKVLVWIGASPAAGSHLQVPSSKFQALRSRSQVLNPRLLLRFTIRPHT